MCGIAGVAARGPVAINDAVGAALRWRGPDADGAAAADGPGWQWRLVHTRLSIVDLSTSGNQPMANEDGSLVMVFNGEIYNYAALRRECEAAGHRFSSSMDGEVILHLWEMQGAAALDRLNGIFAVAVADATTGEVVIARDPLGVKPLFYVATPDRRLWFASELQALIAAGAPVGGDDTVALAQFLSFMWVPDPRTPFAEARSLLPGHALRWVPGGAAEVFRYCAPLVPAGPDDVSPAEAVHEVRERFADAARRQMLGDVPIGLMASGGVDSGLIWWAVRDQLACAFTIEWEDASGAERLGEDAEAVAELEHRFGTPVRRLLGESGIEPVLPPSGDLFADPAYDLTRLIARTAREEGYKVLLSGQGGDELFGGYRRHTVAPYLEHLRLGGAARAVEAALRRAPGNPLRREYLTRLARGAAERDGFSAYMQLCTYSTAAERAEALGCTEAEVTNEIVWQRHRRVFDDLPAGASFFRRVTALDLGVYMPGLGLAYVDRAGMEHSVEIRVPWLDVELVRWALRLPDDALMQRGRGKWLTRELAARELSHGLGHRQKRGFAAPAHRVRPAAAAAGSRGFRQGAFFGRARMLLEMHLNRSHAKAA